MKTIVIFIKSMAAPGGIERVISNLIDVWHKKYHIVLLVKDKEKKSFYNLPADIDCISIEEPLRLNMNSRGQRVVAVASNLLKSHVKLKKVLRNINFDYIYTTTSMNGLEVYLANPNYRNKMVVSEHASAFAVNKIYQQVKRFLYPKVYCVSVPNQMDCLVYKKWGCNTKYIPHLVPFKVNERNKLDSKVVLNVGRYTADKRQRELIEIWSKVKDKNGWVLWIVGSGEEKNNLENAIDEYGVRESVKLIPHTNFIEEIYRKSSLFVLTSRMEGFGMVLLEAMAFGIPCLSYDCPSGPRDVIKDQYNGRLVENGNKYQFSTILQAYLNLPDFEKQQYGQHAIETVDKWDNDAIVGQWDEVFKYIN